MFSEISIKKEKEYGCLTVIIDMVSADFTAITHSARQKVRNSLNIPVEKYAHFRKKKPKTVSSHFPTFKEFQAL
jgi:hypothetical protein